MLASDLLSLQIYSLKKASRLLVCAPSNSAADLLVSKNMTLDPLSDVPMASWYGMTIVDPLP